MLLVGKEYVMDRAYSMHGDMANAYRISVRKRKGTRWLQKPRRRWEDNINMNLREIGWERVDWIHLAQG
jgi:hypothetical protein